VDPALEYRLKGDSHHLRQILLNLLGNAIKFTERGEVNLIVGLKQETVNGVTARFEVEDTGIGIAPDALSKIFERFVQADQSTTRKYGGTGLGTTIAKQLVELMGGTIGVESTLGEGSTFWLELPLLRDAPLEASSSEEDLHEVDNRGTCLVLAAPGHGDVAAILRSIGERYEVLLPNLPIAARIDQLSASGTTIRAVIASCAVEQACAAFNATVQRLPEARVALIYIANGDVSVVDRARVNSIKGAFALEHATPRLIVNAIHAVTAGADYATGGADLSVVLERERAPLKVLVAEDNSTNQKIIRQLLENAGYEVVLASDGEEALDVYESEEPDLAILDFNMPQRTGIEVIQAIRMMEPQGSRMPAIILSASVTLEARERAAKAGADEFIGKPFDAASLIHQIDRLGKRVTRTKDESRPQQRGRTDTTRDEAVVRWSRQRSDVLHSSSALIDRSRLSQLEDIARDVTFLGELVSGFIADVDTILLKSQRVVVTGDSSPVPDLMHSLKGAAVGVGATRLATLAEELERSAPDISAEETKRKLGDIQSCFEATSAHLKQYLHAQHYQ
jgi:two-component system sensor histidine kinase RpfC